MKAHTDVIESFRHNTKDIPGIMDKPHLIKGVSTFIAHDTGHNPRFVRNVIESLYDDEHLPREHVQDYEPKEPWA